MTYIPIVPHVPVQPFAPTERARHLGEDLSRTIRRFQKEHHGMEAAEVQQALELAAREFPPSRALASRQALTAAMGVLGALAAGGLVVATREGPTALVGPLVAGIVVILVLGLVAARVSRR